MFSWRDIKLEKGGERIKNCEYQFVGEIIKAVKTRILASFESKCVFILKGCKKTL